MIDFRLRRAVRVLCRFYDREILRSGFLRRRYFLALRFRVLESVGLPFGHPLWFVGQTKKRKTRNGN